MNKYFLIITFSLITLNNLCFSQTLHFDTTVFDLGIIEKGSDAKFITKFYNNGNKIINGLQIKSSGGGQVASCLKCDSILPGEFGFVKIEYCTQKIGPFNKSIVFAPNLDYENSKITIFIKGEVILPKNGDNPKKQKEQWLY